MKLLVAKDHQSEIEVLEDEQLSWDEFGKLWVAKYKRDVSPAAALPTFREIKKGITDWYIALLKKMISLKTMSYQVQILSKLKEFVEKLFQQS